MYTLCVYSKVQKNPKPVCFQWSRLEYLYTYFVYIDMANIKDNILIYSDVPKSMMSCKHLHLHPVK